MRIVPLREKVRRIGARELARRSGISASHISLISRGMRNPSFKVAQKLAGTLGISTDDLARLIQQEREAA